MKAFGGVEVQLHARSIVHSANFTKKYFVNLKKLKICTYFAKTVNDKDE
jgi:hypothetical protein